MRGYGDEISAQIDKLGHSICIGWVVPAYTDILAAGSDLWNNITHHPAHLSSSRVSHALSQIASRNVKYVGAIHRKNVIYIINRLDVFDHWNDQCLSVYVASRLIHGNPDSIVVSAPASDASVSIRIVACRSRYRIGLLASIDVGHDNPLDPSVEKAQYRGVRVVMYTKQ